METLDEKNANSNEELEKQANTFAAELLVPLKELGEAIKKTLVTIPSKVDDRQVILLASRFGVGHECLLWRLRILCKATPESTRKRIRSVDWHALWEKHDPEGYKETQVSSESAITWKPEGVSDDTARHISKLPNQYREMAFSAYSLGKITAGKLAEILELPSRRVVKDELQPLLRPEVEEENKELQQFLEKAYRENS